MLTILMTGLLLGALAIAALVGLTLWTVGPVHWSLAAWGALAVVLPLTGIIWTLTLLRR